MGMERKALELAGVEVKTKGNRVPRMHGDRS